MISYIFHKNKIKLYHKKSRQKREIFQKKQSPCDKQNSNARKNVSEGDRENNKTSPVVHSPKNDSI